MSNIFKVSFLSILIISHLCLVGLKEAYKFEVSGRPEDLPPPGQPTAADLVLYDSRSRELFRLYDEERLKSYSKVTVPGLDFNIS